MRSPWQVAPTGVWGERRSSTPADSVAGYVRLHNMILVCDHDARTAETDTAVFPLTAPTSVLTRTAKIPAQRDGDRTNREDKSRFVGEMRVRGGIRTPARIICAPFRVRILIDYGTARVGSSACPSAACSWHKHASIRPFPGSAGPGLDWADRHAVAGHSLSRDLIQVLPLSGLPRILTDSANSLLRRAKCTG